MLSTEPPGTHAAEHQKIRVGQHTIHDGLPADIQPWGACRLSGSLDTVGERCRQNSPPYSSQRPFNGCPANNHPGNGASNRALQHNCAVHFPAHTKKAKAGRSTFRSGGARSKVTCSWWREAPLSAGSMCRGLIGPFGSMRSPSDGWTERRLELPSPASALKNETSSKQ